MKKTILLTICFVLAFTGIAFADACFRIMRQEHWQSAWSQGTINKLAPEERQEYEARTRPFDIIDIYHGWQCAIPPAVQDPESKAITVVIYGLSYEDAVHYKNVYWDFTGEVSEEGEPEVYIKRSSKFRIADGKLPGPAKTLFNNNSYLTFQWEDICGFVTNKLTELDGASCP